VAASPVLMLRQPLLRSRPQQPRCRPALHLESRRSMTARRSSSRTSSCMSWAAWRLTRRCRGLPLPPRLIPFPPFRRRLRRPRSWRRPAPRHAAASVASSMSLATPARRTCGGSPSPRLAGEVPCAGYTLAVYPALTLRPRASRLRHGVRLRPIPLPPPRRGRRPPRAVLNARGPSRQFPPPQARPSQLLSERLS
jgi:hypothetical protein